MSTMQSALRRMTGSGVHRMAATITSMRAHTPSATAITDGPCDAVWVTTDDATLTGTMADGESITTPALPSRQWVPISMATISACSAGSVYVGWYSR